LKVKVESDNWIIAAIATLAGMMVHGLVDTVWYRPQVQLLWWLAIALISSFYISPITTTVQEIE
jgi:putative inorganic carbon (HCO3(-)) transporter